jgi:hypothetical protein
MIAPTASRVESLRESNHRLRAWLERVTGECGRRRAATPEDIGRLLAELLKTGSKLRSAELPERGDDAALDQALDEYRRHVEQVRELLPSIYGDLLAERARIESQRARLQSAKEWAQASRQTL